MNEEERVTLEKLVKQYDCEETTDLVRKVKPSIKIRESMDKLVKLKSSVDYETFQKTAHVDGVYMYENYTNIFNKFVEGELNLEIFERFIVMLERIESGELDQHDASYKIGMLLKDIYIDKKFEMEDEENPEDKFTAPTNNISWKEYKKTQMPPPSSKKPGNNKKKKNRKKK